MQEHFNENYLESDKYPFATFKGKINENMDWAKPGTYSGKRHGQTECARRGTGPDHQGQARRGERQAATGCRLYRGPADHKIEIPTLVFQKIAETIAVTTRFVYQPHVKQ